MWGLLNAVAIAPLNIHLNFRHFSVLHTSAALPFRGLMFRWSNASQPECFVTSHSLPHHRHIRAIEVIKLVIVFFLVWLSSARDTLKDARFFPSFHILFTPSRRTGGKHQRTLSRLALLLVLLFFRSRFFRANLLSPVQQFEIATQKICFFFFFVGHSSEPNKRKKNVEWIKHQQVAENVSLSMYAGEVRTTGYFRREW